MVFHEKTPLFIRLCCYIYFIVDRKSCVSTLHDCVSSNPRTSVSVGLVPGPVNTTTWNFSGGKFAMPGNSNRKHTDVTSSSTPIMLHCVSMLTTQGGEPKNSRSLQ